MTASRLSSVVAAVAALLLAAACKEDDPTATPDGPRGPDAAVDAPPPIDAPPIDSAVVCDPMTSDYRPRDMNSANDPWPACVSDAMPDRYVQVGASVSTIARIAAFEQIAAKLFIAGAPSNVDFIDARLQYVIDNGLESRVARREDEHYPAAPMACNLVADPFMYPDRCLGPAKLQPMIQGAFAVGAQSADARERRLAAARIEAGLLWFLYSSVYKEAVTCATAPADCDSHWAYYTGGEQRAAVKGFSRYVRGLDAGTHDRIWDGILAMRCWRGLDDPAVTTDDAMFAAFRTSGLAQLDRALLRGVALILRDRIERLGGLAAADAEVQWEMIRHLGPVLQRAMDQAGGAPATTWKAQVAKLQVATVDRAAMVGALDAIFPCP